MTEQLIMTTGGSMVVIKQPLQSYDSAELREFLKFAPDTPLQALNINDEQVMIMHGASELAMLEPNPRASQLAWSKELIALNDNILGDVLIIDLKNLKQ